MSKAGNRMLVGAREALSVAKGEIPAARLHVQGHAYVPITPTRNAVIVQYIDDRAKPVVSIECKDDGMRQHLETEARRILASFQ